MPNAWDVASALIYRREEFKALGTSSAAIAQALGVQDGADVLYAPGLPDMDAIRAVVRAVVPKPVNVLIGPRSGVVRFAN
jgi:2-methylisocitrate lyase-like PEP mutase family enzyme